MQKSKCRLNKKNALHVLVLDLISDLKAKKKWVIDLLETKHFYCFKAAQHYQEDVYVVKELLYCLEEDALLPKGCVECLLGNKKNVL